MIRRALIVARKWWAVGVAVLALCGAAAVLLLRRKNQQEQGPALKEAIERYVERRSVANARAAVSITAARTKNAEIEAELAQANAEPDRKKRHDAIIALDERLRSGR